MICCFGFYTCLYFKPFSFFVVAGRQSSRADQRSSGLTSRCKPSDSHSTFSGTVVEKLPVFPLNSCSPPPSPTKVKAEREVRPGETKRHHQAPGSRPGVPSGGGQGQKAQGRGLCAGKGLLTESQVRLLVGLHYLPHEHGPSAQKLLQDLTWLKTNCHVISISNKKSPPQKVRESLSSLQHVVCVVH